MGAHDYTIYDFINQNAKLYPNLDAIVFKEKRLNFLEYKNRCDSLAAGLSDFGIEMGDRIGILAQNSEEYMILLGAVAKIGAIVLTINWRFQPDEVEFVLSDCTPRVVFASDDFQRTAIEAMSKVSSIEKCFLVGEGTAMTGVAPLESLYQKEGSDREHDIPANSGYVIIHTAAVEGRPRGALLSQANLIYHNVLMTIQYGLKTDDRNVGFLPLFHVAGLTMALAVMHAGGKNIIMDRFDAAEALNAIEKEKGTLFFHFAPILGRIMDQYESGTYDISSLRNIAGMDSGQNIKRFMELAPHVVCHTGFAQTEAMGVSRAPMTEKWGSAGKPSALTSVRLFDDVDNEVPVGSPGEICVRSPTVFLGYWGREEDTAYTFRNGWHHTGDIGRFDEDGYLFYVKRKAQKELIKPGGENVYPAEVEKTILEHDSVAEVSVIGVADPKWGEAIKAICVLKSGKSLDSTELIEFVGSKIARYKKPQHVVFVNSLPKTKEGEIDRDQVKKEHGALY